MSKSTNVISHTKKWLDTVIIAHNICPFAKREVDKESVHFEIIQQDKTEEQLQEVIFCCKQLDGDNSVETSLLILPNSLNNFDDFLDFLEIANDLLDQQGYEGVYQLASFHPNYCFEGSDMNDASNYTNRSPYPMLHIIREASLERVLENYKNPEKIPERNIEYTKELGLAKMQSLLDACYRT